MKRFTKILSPEMLGSHVCIVIGTRPGIIKMAPLYHEAKKRNLPTLLIHTGQHYSAEMDAQIMADCELPKPDHRVTIKPTERTHAQQTAKMMVGIEDILLREKPGVVLVCGDANTNFAAAVAARKLHIHVGHVEAGLRSRDWLMPEEHNRVMIDHISEYLFAPTEECRENLINENVRGEIHVVGNTIVEAALNARRKAESASKILKRLSLQPGGYALLTLHREENVDSQAKCGQFIDFVHQIAAVMRQVIVFPMHPRSRLRFEEYGFMERLSKLVKIVDPVPYLDFINLETNSHIILTDSGGLQEEACILRVPCFTLRETTERWETVAVGANHIVGFSPSKFIQCYKENCFKEWRNPYGDGSTSQKIIDVIARRYNV
jgi:UDP-N-acetylglucosamine 2-epimerase (non-hydrolysing)